MTAEAPKLFFTPDEAAVILGWHAATVRRKCLAGELRYERSSGGRMSHMRILAVDVYRMAGQELPDRSQEQAEAARRRDLVRAVRVKMAEVAMLLAELEA